MGKTKNKQQQTEKHQKQHICTKYSGKTQTNTKINPNQPTNPYKPKPHTVLLKLYQTKHLTSANPRFHRSTNNQTKQKRRHNKYV